MQLYLMFCPRFLMSRRNSDPHRDPHGEMSGRKQWNKQAATSSFLDKKPPKSLVQQGLEGSTAVGKDEVGSSNLPSSSKMNDPTQFEQVDET